MFFQSVVLEKILYCENNSNKNSHTKQVLKMNGTPLFIFSPKACIKWVEIIFVAVVFGLCLPGFRWYGGYTYIVIESLICLILTIIFLVIIIGGHWWELERIFCYLACLMNIAAFGVGFYCCLVLFNNITDPRVPNIVYDWDTRMVFITIFSGLAAILYLWDVTPIVIYDTPPLVHRTYLWRVV